MNIKHVSVDLFSQIKETMLEANKEHKGTLVKMDQKFFEEKVGVLSFTICLSTNENIPCLH